MKNISEFTRLSDDEFTTVDLNEVVSKTLQIMNFKLSRNNIELQCSLSSTPSVLSGVLVHLVQVLVNLIGNSIKSIDTNGHIIISTSINKDKVHLKVEDNGCGIPKSCLNKVFDPFYSKWRMNIGTGLGLSVVKRIVERHAGTIEIESKNGVGTTIDIAFPYTA